MQAEGSLSAEKHYITQSSESSNMDERRSFFESVHCFQENPAHLCESTLKHRHAMLKKIFFLNLKLLDLYFMMIRLAVPENGQWSSALTKPCPTVTCYQAVGASCSKEPVV